MELKNLVETLYVGVNNLLYRHLGRERLLFLTLSKNTVSSPCECDYLIVLAFCVHLSLWVLVFSGCEFIGDS